MVGLGPKSGYQNIFIGSLELKAIYNFIRINILSPYQRVNTKEYLFTNSELPFLLSGTCFCNFAFCSALTALNFTQISIHN